MIIIIMKVTRVITVYSTITYSDDDSKLGYIVVMIIQYNAHHEVTFTMCSRFQ